MSLGVFIWALLSIALLGFLGWTAFILARQKSTWREFARQRNLRFKVRGFLLSPEITGVIRDYSIALFTAEHGSEQSRTTRKMSAIEIVLKSAMPVGGAVGSGDMVALIQGRGYSQEYKPKIKAWDKEYIAMSHNARFLKAYLTKERLAALIKLMKTKNVWVIFIFNGPDTLLRIDTPDALDDLDKLNKTMEKLLEVAGVLELAEGESQRLVAEAEASISKSDTAPSLKEPPEDGGLALELEED